MTRQTFRRTLGAAAAGALALGLALVPAVGAQAASVVSAPASIPVGGDAIVVVECTGTAADRVSVTIQRLDSTDAVVTTLPGGMFPLDASSVATIGINSDSLGVASPGDYLRFTMACMVTIDVTPAEEVFAFAPVDIAIDFDTVPVDPGTDPGTDPMPGTPPNPGVRFRTGIEDVVPGSAVLVGLGVLLLAAAAAGMRRARHEATPLDAAASDAPRPDAPVGR